MTFMDDEIDNLDRVRIGNLQTKIDLLNARAANPEPLRADEIRMQVSRAEYRTLLELACEALRKRLSQ